MQDKTYDTRDDPDPRLTCAKVHYSHCQNKGHIDSCYKLDGTAPAFAECEERWKKKTHERHVKTGSSSTSPGWDSILVVKQLINEKNFLPTIQPDWFVWGKLLIESNYTFIKLDLDL